MHVFDELTLFRCLLFISIVDLISKLGLQKSSVVQHMTKVIQPLLEKGIVDHSIIHSALIEYFSIADKVIKRFSAFHKDGFALPVSLLYSSD